MRRHPPILAAILAGLAIVPASAPARADGTGVEAPRRLLIGPDGRTFFPIGLYGFPPNRDEEAIRRDARAAGFNFLVGQDARQGFRRSADIPGGPPDPDAATRRGSLLDLAHQADKKRALIAEMVARDEKTQGVVVWQGPDEPNYFPFGVGPGPTPEGLAAGAAALRARSRLPLWINFGPTGDHLAPDDFGRLRPYLAAPDVVSVDIYPIGPGSDLQRSPFADRGPACVGTFTRHLVRMVSRDGIQRKPVWMVLQAFGWGDLARASKPPESWTGRPPTRDEIRFMTFDAVINGAGGVIYWGAPFLPEGDSTWDALKSVATELRDLLPVLAAEALPADQVVHPSNPAIEAAVRRRPGNKTTLLLANTTEKAVEVGLSFHGIKPRTLKPVGRTTATPSPASPPRYRFRPLDVAIFEIEH